MFQFCRCQTNRGRVLQRSDLVKLSSGLQATSLTCRTEGQSPVTVHTRPPFSSVSEQCRSVYSRHQIVGRPLEKEGWERRRGGREGGAGERRGGREGGVGERRGGREGKAGERRGGREEGWERGRGGREGGVGEERSGMINNSPTPHHLPPLKE